MLFTKLNTMSKSKFFVSIIFSIFLLSACKNSEEGIVVEPTQTDGSHLSIDVILNHLPDELNSNNKAVYKSAVGELKNMTIFEKNLVVEHRESEFGNYTADKREISLYEEDDLAAGITLHANANYVPEKNTIARSLSVHLAFFNPAGMAHWTVSFDENGPIITPADDFHPTLTLDGKTFNDCYIINGTNPDAFSEIIVNLEIGVVAFRDINNDLFVFQEYVPQ